jgi:DNA polymerase-4
MPVDVLQQLIGKNGTELWKKANGIDNTPVIQYSERKSISTETTFAEDTIDVQNIRSILLRNGRAALLPAETRAMADLDRFC